MMKTIVEPAVGDVLGQNYLLEKELGRGGFGVVFKATHLDIERPVAIKVLLATSAAQDPRATDRFRREARIAASLGYPNSLRVFDYGETEGGVFYIVMEFLTGQDLRRVLDVERRLSAPRAVHIVRQVLHALMEAHANGIVHRDIKPDNIMIVPLEYDPDFVKVMDFGIAKMVDGPEQITQGGITLGTPRYMPIEQLKGKKLDATVDIYALGLTLYEMLVGAPAFDQETAVDCALAVMQSPSIRVPADADVPDALRAIIEKAAAREPEERFQDTRAFLKALNALDPALLDIDANDRERFTTGQAVPTKPRGVTGRIEVVADDEAAVKTQAIATAEVLAAKPPRGRLSRTARRADTVPVKVPLVPEPATAPKAAKIPKPPKLDIPRPPPRKPRV